MEHLLAKSVDENPPPFLCTLSGHLLCAEKAATILLDKLKPSLCKRFGIEDFNTFKQVVRVAALLHDLGKCSKFFHRELKGDYRGKHPFYHEVFSAFLLWSQSGIRKPIRMALGEEGFAAVIATILGHHLRIKDPIRKNRRAGSPDFEFRLGHDTLETVWERLSGIIGRAEVETLQNTTSPPHEVSRALGEAEKRCKKVLKRGNWAPEQVSIAKSILICSDIIASSIAGKDKGIGEFIEERIGGPLGDDEIQAVIDIGLKGNDPRSFQEEVASSDKRVTVVTAGCGNGKTVAAYMWAKGRADRVIFSYPTTGTASAGFEDYLLSTSGLDSKALMHSRASADIEYLLRDTKGKEEVPQDPESLQARDAIDLWSTEIATCTVDSVLGLMGMWRKPMASLPAWTNAAFVFDEVHAYDRLLFGALLSFIRVIDAPVLIMTASLSPERLDAIERVAGQQIDPIKGKESIEGAERYRLKRCSVEDAPDIIHNGLNRGKKALLVCNTVRRAREMYDALQKDVPYDRLHLYHSRFRYRDRVRIQGEVVNAFSGRGPCVVVATQVCEMSLDISGDILLTDNCPLPYMAQRLGRLNRPPTPKEVCDCYVIKPDSVKPYRKEQLQVTSKVIDRLKGKAISQQDIAKEIRNIEEATFAEKKWDFTTKYIQSAKQSIRDMSRGSDTVILEKDVGGRKKLKKQEAIGLSVPMPRHGDTKNWKTVGGIPVAPEGEIIDLGDRGIKWNR